MAATSSTGFKYGQNLYGKDTPVAIRYRLGNSATMKIGDAIRLNTAGGIVRVAAGNPVLGVLVGITDEKGTNPFGQGYVNGTGATLSGDDTVTSASDNTTRTNYLEAEVIVDPAGSILWYNDANGDFALTNTGQLCDVVAASDQIDQSSASDTSGQFQLVKIDPDKDADASKGMFRIAEPQLLTQIGNSSTVVAA